MFNDANNFETIKKLANTFAGYPLRGAATALEDGETALIQLRNVSLDSSIAWNDIAYVSLPSIRKNSYLDEGDIIFSARGTQNIAHVIPKRSHPIVCAPQFFVIRIQDKSKVLPEFLAWQINAVPAQHYFDTVALGSAMKSIRRADVENLKISIPTLARQKAIVNLWRTTIEEEQTLEKLINNRKKLLNGLAHGLVNKRETL